ncbi:cytochrome P450 [Eremomyces bilateralis CBS 781.70]|uniref:Cytochrome P450 n=1 Tax=Eremomyces bilateralis CBS 781.70 TaxID=1392243 RepID=A0A6G1GF27_9PEZI|nr:cytochrome P450 [Eremomyces bilateralis CBS 781.70]KAF1816634.1 cytochrome P450 [Eremomyces bilateralis CBS 781.70]
MERPALLSHTEMLSGIALGLLTHVLFKRFEPALAEFSLIPIILGFIGSVIWSLSIPQTLSLVISFLSALSSSVLFYRLIAPWHPLHHVPGPFLAKCSQVWLFSRLYKGRPRVDQRVLHEKYGPIVRIGPNEVSLADAASLSVIYGGKPWVKGKSYSFTASGGAATSETALSSIRDHEEHKFRRRIWDRAFSISSLKEYQPAIRRRTEQLCNQLDRLSTTGSLDLQEWISYFVFDVMTDLAWGAHGGQGGGNALIEGIDPDGAIASLRYSLHLAGMTKVLPWFARYLLQFPWVTKKMKQFHIFSRQMFLNRQKRGSNPLNKSQRDVFYHLLGEGSSKGAHLSVNALQADSRQVVTGGADTTVSAITYLFYCLVCNPERFRRLQTVVDEIFKRQPHGQDIDIETLNKEPLLDAYINEAMRLEPPIPFQNQRIVPEGGTMIRNVYLPPGTHIRSALYAISRAKENFSCPDEFRPERWLPGERHPGEIFNAKASIPFITGPYHCVGRNFAMQEMRYVVAFLVRRYDMRLIDGFDRKRFEEGIEDRSLLEIERPLEVMIRQR